MRGFKTNIGDIKLSVITTHGAAAAGAAGAAVATAVAATDGATAEATTGAAARGVESWFRFSVLGCVSTYLMARNRESHSRTDLSYIDQAAHQVLVAESRDGVLSLIPRSIFHNSKKTS